MPGKILLLKICLHLVLCVCVHVRVYTRVLAGVGVYVPQHASGARRWFSVYPETEVRLQAPLLTKHLAGQHYFIIFCYVGN